MYENNHKSVIITVQLKETSHSWRLWIGIRSAHCIHMNRMRSAHCIHMNRMRRRIVFIWITMRLWIRIRRRWIGIRRRIPIHMNKDTPAHPIPMNSNTPAYPYSYEYRYAKRIGNHKRHECDVSYSCNSTPYFLLPNSLHNRVPLVFLSSGTWWKHV